MKYLITIFFSISAAVPALSYQDSTILIDRKITVSKNQFRVIVKSNPSSQSPKGYCGVGEEVYLNIMDSKGRKNLFSQLIESCLKNMILLDSEATNTQSRIEASVDFNSSPIQIRWLLKEGHDKPVGLIKFRDSKFYYEETF